MRYHSLKTPPGRFTVKALLKSLTLTLAAGGLALGSSSTANAQHDSLKIYLTRAGGALQQGNHQYAKESFEQALRFDSMNVNALKGLGTIASANGYHNNALAFFKRAASTGAEDSHIYHNLGVTYEILQQPESSFVAHKKAVELAPDNFVYMRDFGVALMNASRFSNAIVTLQKALKINPTDGETKYLIGNCYAALPDPQSAIKSFNEAIDLGYDNGTLRYHLGMACEIIGDKLSAEEHLGFAVGKSPDSLEYRQRLGVFYLQEGIPDQARNFFRDNLTRDSTFINSRIGLGVAYAYLGQMDSAYAELAKVKRISAERAQVMTGMIDRAIETLRIIDSLNNAALESGQTSSPQPIDPDDK